MLILAACVMNNAIAQNISDYRVKTKSNEATRTKILDILRAKLYEEYKQEFIFVVNKLNVTSTYAWFEGDVQRKDGKQVKVYPDDDCCHVEALLKQSGGKWYIVEMAAFATDVWWYGMWERYGLSKKLFLN